MRFYSCWRISRICRARAMRRRSRRRCICTRARNALHHNRPHTPSQTLFPSRAHSPPSHLSPFFFQLPAVHLQILLHSVVLREQRGGITRGIGLALVEYARGQPKVVREVRQGGAGECSVRCLGHGCFDQHAREVRRGGEPTPRAPSSVCRCQECKRV